MGKKRRYEDISGQIFNKLTVLRYSFTKKKKIYWECQCECGNKTTTLAHSLKHGLTKSCGCLNKKERKKIEGQRFKYLLVKEYKGKSRTKMSMYECMCDCGNITIVVGANLTNGHTRSCGCLQKKKARKHIIKVGKHNSGKNHPRWRHDLTDEDRKESRDRHDNPRLRRWRLKVFKKYNYLCQKCKRKKNNINAHHIFSWNSHPKLRFVAKNGIVLCEECHSIFHKIYGYGNNNKEQIDSFLN